MRVNRGRRNWQSGKRNLLIKARSEVNFKDNMQRGCLVLGHPLFVGMAEEHFVPWGYSPCSKEKQAFCLTIYVRYVAFHDVPLPLYIKGVAFRDTL